MRGRHAIVRDATGDDLPALRDLLRDYQAWLNVGLGLQQFDHEFAALPGEYAPPAGRLLVGILVRHAEVGPEPDTTDAGVASGFRRIAAVVGFRPLDDRVCEMKRLFVHPSARGAGLGRALVARVLDEARGIGYREIRLDTLPAMQEAQTLYEAFGFRDIPPYYDCPVPGMRFMAKAL